MNLSLLQIPTLLLLTGVVNSAALAQLLGRVEQHSFTGGVLGNTVFFNIYLPEGYDIGTQRYPVIYFLHGLNGNQGGPSNTIVPRSYEDARAAGILGPVIVVFPNGYLDSLWVDSFDGSKPAETDVIRQLIPHVDATFRTMACPSQRVVTGFSMGGYGAALLYTKYPEMFTASISYDGSLVDWANLQRLRPDWAATTFGGSEAYFDQFSPWHWSVVNAEALTSRNDFRMVVARQEDTNWQFLDYLAALGISTNLVETGCPHDMNCMLAAQGMNSAAFIAARLGSPAVSGAPTIAAQPASVTTCLAGSASFSVTVSGADPYVYQWRSNGLMINTANNSSAATAELVLSDIQPGDAGDYDCLVSNTCGSVISNPATLTICAADFNCDGSVDFFDYLDFVDSFSSNLLSADFNGDGSIDFFDYLDFADSFSGGC